MAIHTHPDIVDRDLRNLLAEELNVLRNIARDEICRQDEWIFGVILGFETAMRRIQAMREETKHE